MESNAVSQGTNGIKSELPSINYTLGDGTYGMIKAIGEGTVKIGKYCSFAPGIKAMLLSNHRVDWVSTYPFPTVWGLSISGHPIPSKEIEIGNDVWIGREAIILGGTKIGDGAVIGAYSVVAGEIPPYSIVAGNPAKVIRKRFSDEVIKKLLDIAWWNWDEEKLVDNVEFICSDDIEKFIKEFS